MPVRKVSRKVSLSYLIIERLRASSVYRKLFNECLRYFFAMNEVGRREKEFDWSYDSGIILAYCDNEYHFDYILNGDEVYWMDHSTDTAINAIGMN